MLDLITKINARIHLSLLITLRIYFHKAECLKIISKYFIFNFKFEFSSTLFFLVLYTYFIT